MAERTEQTWWTLRVVFGGIAFLAGLDKFFHLLTDWTDYLWGFIPQVLNIAPTTFMYAVGVVEMLVGILIFTRYTKYAAFVMSGWLLAIALNLVITGYYDIAVRDVGLATGAFVLGMMSPAPDVQARRGRVRTRTVA